MNDQENKQIQQLNNESTRQMIFAAMNKKSMGIGILLTFIFGGPGLLYASIAGGIIMTFLEVIGWFFFFFFWGTGIFLLIPLHLISLIWTIIAIDKHNKNLLLLG